jgi:hypothetical protein
MLGEFESVFDNPAGWGPSFRSIVDRDRCCDVDCCVAGAATAEAAGAWTCNPIPSCVDVRAVVGLDTTLTGDVATVAVESAVMDPLRFRP